MASLPPVFGIHFFPKTRIQEKTATDNLRASDLLQLGSVHELESRVLGTDAFLKPWASFRDALLLLQPSALPQSTNSKSTPAISRLDLLWFYTQFDENTRRYDPRTDRSHHDYDPSFTDFGVIDKSAWVVRDYEKHMFAWLLQTFKIGKKHNPLGFEYFVLRNVCVAWEEVFIPIVDMVRASYSVKGRQHYGRLATFIEGKSPSGLAFPEANVNGSLGRALTSPFRLLSKPRKEIGHGGMTEQSMAKECGILSKKHYDETEQELRRVYPQYGGLVERPKLKQRMDEWLAEQRARVAIKKLAQPQQAEGSPAQDPNESHSLRSPIKRYSDSIRRSLSFQSSQKEPEEKPKSAMHGHTTYYMLPEEETCLPPSPVRERFPLATTIPTGYRPQREPSERTVYESIRQNNPFKVEGPQDSRSESKVVDKKKEKLSVKERPAETKFLDPRITAAVANTSYKSMRDEVLAIRAQRSAANMRKQREEEEEEEARYRDEKAMAELNALLRKNRESPRDRNRSMSSRSRVPAPIQPIQYGDYLRSVSEQQRLGELDFEIPRHVPWLSDSDEDIPPPVPQKSPVARSARRPINDPPHRAPLDAAFDVPRTRPGRSNQLVQQREAEESELSRIVSKEHIRSALGNISPESSNEHLPSRVVSSPSRVLTPGGSKLVTYNKHYFPRRDRHQEIPSRKASAVDSENKGSL